MRLIPRHWRFTGPRRVSQLGRLLRYRNVPGAHVAAMWRIVRIGPWTLLAIRYRPGNVEEPE